MSGFKQDNLSDLLANVRKDRDNVYNVLVNLPGCGRGSNSGYMIHDVYVSMCSAIADLDQIVEFRVDADMFVILKKFQNIYAMIKKISTELKHNIDEESREVSAKLLIINNSLRDNLTKFKKTELKNPELDLGLDELNNFIHESKSNQMIQDQKECVSGINCYNHLKVHCESFSHPKRICPKGENCNKTDERHFENYEHPE